MYLNITRIQCCISILSTETLKDVVWGIFGTRWSTDANVRCSLKLNALTEKTVLSLYYKLKILNTPIKKKLLTKTKLNEYNFSLDISFFLECLPGYIGLNCTIKCPYPTYGSRCKRFCECSNYTCDVSTGCRSFTTG